MAAVRVRRDTVDSFMERVLPEPNSGCWLWMGACINTGYGSLTVKNNRVLAHRQSYLLHIGPIPIGKELDHLCRNPLCVNPLHLEPVTHQVNGKRGTAGRAFGLMMAARTHCRNGHEFTVENTTIHKNKSGRLCRECSRERDRRYRKEGRRK